MSTRKLAFGGVISALCSILIIMSSLFHLITPLVISCALCCICAKKCGATCATLVIITSNVIGFFVGGIGGGEIFFSVLLFSPFAIVVYCTAPLSDSPLKILLRAAIFAAFSLAIYVLFVTVLKDVVSIGGETFGVGESAFGVLWTVVMTIFGFALDKGATVILKRFKKNDQKME